MKIRCLHLLYGIGLLLLLPARGSCRQQAPVRHELNLDSGWHTVENDSDLHAYTGFEKPGYDDRRWNTVEVPHNWDDYGGYRRLLNGNRYGYAWYRKTFKVPDYGNGKHYFLWFEGVGSYATVWLNGKKIGSHGGGRTSFTLDVTAAIHPGGKNLLCVTADEPTGIRDLPWVSGGDSPEPGFSEGSQPLGIFRPVHLLVTKGVRVIPFGVHIWNDTTVTARSATLCLETRVRN
ncbi:MAG TPA: beta galactosidase jelly roll domain-containing protein, partial [Chitinophagaceae bacterium]|nr:beta galactosidase jelly roll domain-containing protein [Chitinophagaceae bacterium]